MKKIIFLGCIAAGMLAASTVFAGDKDGKKKDKNSTSKKVQMTPVSSKSEYMLKSGKTTTVGTRMATKAFPLTNPKK